MEPVNESPKVLGNRYEVGDLLGRGGMAEVHLGRDTRLGRVVAIKLLRTDLARDPIFQARFRREAQSAAALNHPAIVAVYDTGEEQVIESGGAVVGLPYIVMEYVEGRTLRELLRDGRTMDLPLALEVTSGVLSALEYSHRTGIVHRDIKPANVMLTPAGDVKVMDFGIARALADSSATMTQTQAVIGTAQYLSPEQARGETVDARSDLYSAGCLLFELITGRPPFTADSPVAVAYQHVREMPKAPSTYNPTIPETVDRVVLHALTKDRELRYQTASDFKADVDAARFGRPIMAGPAGVAPDAATEYYGAVGGQTRTLSPPAGYVGAQATPAYGAAGSFLPGMTDDRPDPHAGEISRRSGGGGDRAGNRNRGLGYALLALAVLVVFGVAAYLVTTVLNGSSTASVQVPNVAGMTKQAASQDLQTLGLVVQFAPDQASATIPKDTVISQLPTFGNTLAKGSTVTLTASSGPNAVTVTDVTGLTQTAARAALTAQGLSPGDTQTVDQPNVPAGNVVSTNPKAGTSVALDTPVTLIIASGNVVADDFTGQDRNTASAALGKLGLIVVEVGKASAKPLDQVISQDQHGTLPEGSTVTLTYASGPLPTTSSPSPTTSSPNPTTSAPGTSPTSSAPTTT